MAKARMTKTGLSVPYYAELVAVPYWESRGWVLDPEGDPGPDPTDFVTETELAAALAELEIGDGALDSVNGQTGVVVLDAADVDADPAGTATSAVAAHVAAGDPHGQYLTETAATAGYQPLDSDLTAIAGLTHADDMILQTKSGAWAARTPAQVKTDLALVKADVGLSNVSNLSSTSLRDRATHTGTQASTTISDFTEAVQDAVAALLGAGSNVTLTYNDGANTLTVAAAGGGLDAEAVRDAIGVALVGVGIISVAVNDALDTITVSTTATANSTDAQLRDRATHTGTQSADTIVDGTTNHTFTAADDTKLGGVATGATANSSDATLPARANHSGTQAVSTVSGLQAALDAKAPLASPAFTGTPTGITKAHVGLGNVDNTSDAGKPVSTATQTALDGKQALDSDLTAVAALTPDNDDVIQRKGGVWVARDMGELWSDLETWYPTLATGDWFIPSGVGVSAAPGVAESELRTLSWIVTRPVTIDGVGIDIGTASVTAGAVARLVIYADTGQGRPGALLVDAGTVAADTTGIKTITISDLALGRGRYWIGAVLQLSAGTTYAPRAVQNTFHPDVPVWLGPSLPGNTGAYAGWQQNGVTGAAPNPFTTTPTGAGTVPRLFVRVA